MPSNAMFGRQLLPALEPERRALESSDLYLFDVMNAERLRGQIVFEYGTLLRAVDRWPSLRVLDIGTGRSTLPRWMSRQGADVVVFDLSTPVEVRAGGFQHNVDRVISTPASVVRPVAGSMQHLPFAGDSFDLATSLSVVEHLDTDFPARTYVPRDEQTRRLRTVLDEMIRVTKPGGLLYLTSDCCDYQRASVDHWRGAYYYDDGPPLSAAWPVRDVPALFYEYLAARGLQLVGGVTYDANAIADERHWTFRGPYFSGFSVLARKRSASA